MNISETIRAFEIKRLAAADRQKAIMQAASNDGRTLEDEEESEYDALTTELEAVDKHLVRLHAMEAAEAATAQPVKKAAGSRVSPAIIVRKQDVDDAFPGQSFTRRCIAKAIAHIENHERPAWQIANERWGKTNPTLVAVMKAGIAGGGSGSGEWGAELVSADNRFTGDFITLLQSTTVFDKIGLFQVPANVTIKGQDGTATANWVGESKSIPVSAQDYSTVSLTPLKVAAISIVSKELLRDSDPAAETLVRNSLVDASSQKVDTTFLGAAAVSAGVSPAGILNGLTSTGSNGYDIASVINDMRELTAPFITAKYDTTGLTLVMHPALADSLSLMVNALGQSAFPGITAAGGTLFGKRVVTGHNCGVATIMLMDPRNIWRIGDRGVEVSVSDQATLEQDGAPQGASDTPAASSATIVSMFGTDSVAFKVVRPVNFQKRRSTAVVFIGDAYYGDTHSTTA